MIAWLVFSNPAGADLGTPSAWLDEFMASDTANEEWVLDQERIRWLRANDSPDHWQPLFTPRKVFVAITDGDLAVHFLMRFPETSKWFARTGEMQVLREMVGKDT